MMQRLLLMAALAACAATALAQDNKSVELDEVTIQGARTTEQPDGRWLYPSTEQLARSTDGYSLLAKLALPNIRVDEVLHTVTALTAKGSVQLRINDVAATTQDLLSMDMQAVEHIEFIDSPGVRYGDDVAYVINIRVRRPVSGYVAGAHAVNTLTAANGSETVYAKGNHGRSELALTYSLDYQHFTGARQNESSTYLMDDGSALSLTRRQLHGSSRQQSHEATLTYSLADTAYVLQASLSASRDLRPTTGREAYITTSQQPAFTPQQYDDRSSSHTSPTSLDVYFHRDYSRHQSLTANAVGTVISSRSTNEQGEGRPYHYDTRGHTYTLWGEAIYENRLRPFTLALGLQLSQRYSSNQYHGDAEATNRMHTQSTYVYGQLKGHLGRLAYTGGVGLSRRYYRQGLSRQDRWLPRPKLSVQLPLGHDLRLKYSVEQSQRMSQIALVSDVALRQNSMETLVGNPELKPVRMSEHDLSLTYSSQRLTAQLQGYYRGNAHCNMEHYERRDGHFYKTQTNGDNRCNMFYVQSYNQWDAVPRHLTLTVYGGLYRFFNYGPDYTHTYTAFNGGLSAQAFLGRWALGAYADNGWNFMEGEHRGHQAPAWYLTASYRPTARLTLALYAQHLLAQHPLTWRTEVVSRYLHKDISQHQRDLGNMVTLSLTYRLERGRTYSQPERAMRHQERDTGILHP